MLSFQTDFIILFYNKSGNCLQTLTAL